VSDRSHPHCSDRYPGYSPSVFPSNCWSKSPWNSFHNQPAVALVAEDGRRDNSAMPAGCAITEMLGRGHGATLQGALPPLAGWMCSGQNPAKLSSMDKISSLFKCAGTVTSRVHSFALCTCTGKCRCGGAARYSSAYGFHGSPSFSLFRWAISRNFVCAMSAPDRRPSAGSRGMGRT
jgi:hypothetical protein